MSNWFSKISSQFGPKPVASVSLGAFGKHPAWSDHIEDIGLDTPELLTARQLLYVQGIGGVIDSAVWDSLKEEDLVSLFGHSFLWVSEPDVIIGRLWASSDGKGRKRYPMVICAHTSHVPLALVVEKAGPVLESVETACRSTESQEQVRSIIASARERLKSSLLPVNPDAVPFNPDSVPLPPNDVLLSGA